mgnify:CR=1 FL=1
MKFGAIHLFQLRKSFRVWKCWRFLPLVISSNTTMSPLHNSETLLYLFDIDTAHSKKCFQQLRLELNVSRLWIFDIRVCKSFKQLFIVLKHVKKITLTSNLMGTAPENFRQKIELIRNQTLERTSQERPCHSRIAKTTAAEFLLEKNLWQHLLHTPSCFSWFFYGRGDHCLYFCIQWFEKYWHSQKY